jgi:hypothetical protein
MLLGGGGGGGGEGGQASNGTAYSKADGEFFHFFYLFFEEIGLSRTRHAFFHRLNASKGMHRQTCDVLTEDWVQ